MLNVSLSLHPRLNALVAKQILDNFKDYRSYGLESGDPNAMIALLNYREDGVIP